MTTVLTRAKARIEDSCARLGVPYPWWVPAWSTGAGTVLAVAALIQRRDMPLGLLVPAGLLTLGPLLVWAITGRLLWPWLEAVLVIAGVVVLLTQPLDIDIAPWLLTVAAGEVAATSPLWLALVVTAVCAGVPVVAGVLGHLHSAPVHVIVVLVGLEVGITLRWQIRALAAERANRVNVREQAALAERQRIAREVHDVVGHSLSITLLHVTGARHTLQHDGDVAEAVEALAEAERIGRSAMADIRRSIGLLPASHPATQALPGIEEIATLVERTRGAGVEVHYVPSGDLTSVEPACGLGLYRIAQESLANIVKHAPAGTAEVRLAIDGGTARLTVRNTLSTKDAKRDVNGVGLDGMATRATQLGAELTAGPHDGHWVVDVTVPVLAVSAP
jgi:signal transduction histidine kinase